MGARGGDRREVWAVVELPTVCCPRALDELADAADALLIDAHVRGQLGGSGVRVPWDRLGESLDALDYHPRIMLAGGLTPENVAERSTSWPQRRGHLSGVESSPGIKDHDAPPRLRGHGSLSRSQGMTGPQPTDRFGAFGGRYVPETLIPALDELEDAYAARADLRRSSRRCCRHMSAGHRH